MKKQNSKVEVAFFLASVSESGAWWRNQIRSMPLCVKLNGVTAEDLVEAFAIHDLAGLLLQRAHGGHQGLWYCTQLKRSMAMPANN